MKTVDASAIIKQRIEDKLKTYPAGSVSRRDVILTIPMDYDEEKIQRLNAELTRVIYQQAEDFAKNLPPEKPKGRFTAVAKDISYQDTRAAEEEYKQKLSQAVITTASNLFNPEQ